MFITFLRFADNRSAAADHMAALDEWIARGFADGGFLCAGSLTGGQGGAILSMGEDAPALEARLSQDPFVVHGVVTPEIHEVDVRRTLPALDFLKAPA